MAKTEKRINTVIANPEDWSDKSKQSVSYQFNFVKEYADIEYQCWRCKTDSIFTAEDQKYTYEVRKAYIDQRRNLCTECWKQSNEIAAAIQACEERWAALKDELKNDQAFLSGWLSLLNRREEYVPYRPNTAIKNMLKNLVRENASFENR